jgi:hypothetical protein
MSKGPVGDCLVMSPSTSAVLCSALVWAGLTSPAGLTGLLVTAVHQPKSRDRGRSTEQAQTLLCVSAP